MPSAVEVPTLSSPPAHKLWTREECEQLQEAGLLDPQRYELIEGELVLKVPKGYQHMLAVVHLVALMHQIFGPYHVLPEGTINLNPEDHPKSAPEPDITVMRCPMAELGAPPSPDDILLAVEVSGSSFVYDMTTKASLYARAGIREYWVVDFEARRVIVHRQPEEGKYRDLAAYRGDETIAPLAAPDRTIVVDELFQR